MCLTIKSKSRTQPEPKVAEKDIKVYKVLRKEFWAGVPKFVTPYMNFNINFSNGKWAGHMDDPLCPLESSEYDMVWEVGIGFHAYKTKAAAEADIINLRTYSNIFLSPYKVYEIVICKAYIPKGAHYYIGTENDIVSDSMVIENVTI